jgi:hypothetical protein
MTVSLSYYFAESSRALETQKETKMLKKLQTLSMEPCANSEDIPGKLENGAANLAVTNAALEKTEDGKLETIHPVTSGPNGGSAKSHTSKPQQAEHNSTSPNADPATVKGSKWEKGTSGNPAGRPRGSKNKISLLKEHLLEHEEDELIEKVITMAQGGDKGALIFCLDRLIPRCRERTIDLKLGPIIDYKEMYAATSAVFQAIGAGQITPNEGETLVRIIKTQFDAVVGIYK